MQPIARHPRHQAEYVRRLADLRKACKKMEFALVGRDAILDYLNNTCQALNGRRQPITTHTLDTWIKKRGFPMWQVSGKIKMRTTNLLILAWFWSYRVYKKTRPRRTSAMQAAGAVKRETYDAV